MYKVQTKSNIFNKETLSLSEIVRSTAQEYRSGRTFFYYFLGEFFVYWNLISSSLGCCLNEVFGKRLFGEESDFLRIIWLSDETTFVFYLIVHA